MLSFSQTHIYVSILYDVSKYSEISTLLSSWKITISENHHFYLILNCLFSSKTLGLKRKYFIIFTKMKKSYKNTLFFANTSIVTILKWHSIFYHCENVKKNSMWIKILILFSIVFSLQKRWSWKESVLIYLTKRGKLYENALFFANLNFR
jgi:hypothetical protein